MTLRSFELSPILLTVALSALALTACFDTAGPDSRQTATGEFAAALPDPGEVELTVPGPENGVTFIQVGEFARYYLDTYQITRHVNGTVYGVLSILGDIVQHPATSATEDEAVWGPFTPALEPVTFLLRVQRTGDNQYTYSFMARPRTSTDDADYVPIVVGEAEPKEQSADGRGRGEFTLYWSNLSSMNPSMSVEGTSTVTYEHADLSFRTVEVFFDDFLDPSSMQSGVPIDATYRYMENADTSGDFQFAYMANIHDLGDDRPGDELVQIRTRWSQGGAGRADARITSAEIGADLNQYLGLDQDYVSTSECWDNGFLRTWYDESPVRLTPDDGEPEDGTFNGPGQGDADDCVYDDSLFTDDDISVSA